MRDIANYHPAVTVAGTLEKAVNENIGKTNKKRLVIAVDFDGTITTDIAWPNAGKPNWSMIEFLRQAHEVYGHRLILWTCRAGEPLDIALAALAEWGIRDIFEAVNENLPDVVALYGGLDTRKISADIYIDDKAVGLHSLWPPEMLRLWHRVKEEQ